jgi:hypothetical protein
MKLITSRLTGFFALFVMVLAILLLSHVTAYADPAPAAEESQEHSAVLTPQEVKSLMDKGEGVFIVDVRSLQEFHSAHITGSVSVPLGKVDSLVDAFPRDVSIVFY